MQPHRAEYALRLGIAANAPRMGTAFQEIASDCTAWHLDRGVTTELALTPTIKFSLSSRLIGEELRGVNAFRYRTVQIQNRVERATRGEVEQLDGETRVAMVTPDGIERHRLPQKTLMPVGAIAQAVAYLQAEDTPFTLLMFNAEATTSVFQLDVKRLTDDPLPAVPPSLNPVPVPPGRSWPIQITVFGVDRPPKPILSVRARIFSSGVLERMVVKAGPITLTAYLQSLEMRPVQCADR